MFCSIWDLPVMHNNRGSLPEAFRYAWQGLKYCIRRERNFKIHCLAAVLVLIAAWWYQVNAIEGILLLLVTVLVMLTEMFNTAVERLADIIAPQYHPAAKIAKDVAAGAVLLAAVAAVLTACILIYSRLDGR